MSQYGLNIHWPIGKNEHHPSKGSNAKLTKVDLTQENVELIKFVQKDDFDAFGYAMNTKEQLLIMMSVEKNKREENRRTIGNTLHGC